MKTHPQFELRKFGATFQSVPVAFWDDSRPSPVVDAPYHDPLTVAEVLEFETALKAAGLMKVGHSLREKPGVRDGRKVFYSSWVHHGSSPVKGAGEGRQVPLTGPRPGHVEPGSQSRAESGASLDGVVDVIVKRRREPDNSPAGRGLDYHKHK